jgi:hypothetical protein
VDIIDGKPHIIPKAVAAAVGYLNGGRGARVRPAVKAEVMPKLKRLQEKIEKAKEAQMSDKDMNEELAERADRSEQEKEALRREFSEALARKEAEIRARFQRERAIEAFITENGNKIPPAVRPGLAAFMESLPDTETVVFSERGEDGKETEVRRSPFAFFQDLVRALPDMSHLFKETVRGVAPNNDAEALIQAYMKEHGVSYRQAVVELVRERKIEVD